MDITLPTPAFYVQSILVIDFVVCDFSRLGAHNKANDGSATQKFRLQESSLNWEGKKNMVTMPGDMCEKRGGFLEERNANSLLVCHTFALHLTTISVFHGIYTTQMRLKRCRKADDSQSVLKLI